MNKKHKQVIDEDIVADNGSEVYAEQKTNQPPEAEAQNIALKPNENQVEAQQSQKKKLDEVEQAVSKQSSKKKKIWNWVFFVINIVVVVCILIYQLSQEKVASPIGLTIHYAPLLVLLTVFACCNLSETLGVSYLVKRNVGKWHPALSYKTNAIGRYYDNLTPLATGGQPFQITYLKGHGVPLHSAMSIPLAKMVFHQISWLLISLVCLIVSFVNPKYNTFVSVTSVVGFILGSAVLFMVVFLSISRSVGKKLVVLVLKFLQKIKIIKNYEKQYEKIMKVLEDYQSVMRQYAKSPKDFVCICFAFLTKLILEFTMPYLIFCTFNGWEGGIMFDFFVMTVLINLAASFFPLPGGTGMSELTFSAMFASYFSGGTLFWALITWRFFSYYYYLLQGIGIITYDMFYGNRKYKWMQRKDMLVQESQVFKQEQINRFRAERNRQRKANKR